MPVTNYLWNPLNDNIVREFDDDGDTIADYTTEPELCGNLISQHRDGESSFYHYDGQGNTTSLTNAAANNTDTYAYSAFGDVIKKSGSSVNPFQYVGRQAYYCEEFIGSLVRYRTLIISQARWLSQDPTFSGVTSYHYVMNRPLHFIDPLGLFAVTGPTGHRKTGGQEDSLGGTYRFVKGPLDAPFIIQDVVVTGTLLCKAIGGDYNVVGFRYAWTEVWPFAVDGTFTDTHLNSPRGAIDLIKKHCDCPCDFTKDEGWSFTATAEFDAVDGTVVPKTGSAASSVNASTTYRCVGAKDEGTTVQGKGAVMDMYPGKRAADPAAPTNLTKAL